LLFVISKLCPLLLDHGRRSGADSCPSSDTHRAGSTSRH